MKAKIKINETRYKVNFSKPLDISIAIKHKKGPLAWYVKNPIIEPVVMGDFIGSVAKGSPTNFNKVTFYPHANATHTECIGHITKEFYSVNQCLTQFFFLAEVISVEPKDILGDYIISKEQLISSIKNTSIEAIIIRTLPNKEDKLDRNYSNRNAPYLAEDAAEYLKEIGIKHLLIDLPSVDKEKDNGELVSHKAFFNYHGKYRLDATITEFIFVKNNIKDGLYLLDLQIASMENNASLSKPVLYKVKG